jgi:hypothetical protein
MLAVIIVVCVPREFFRSSAPGKLPTTIQSS